MIDITIVNVALPSMQKSLGVSESGIEWVVAGFILAFALGLLPFGRYGDIIGKKKIFLIGVTSFSIASLLCGMAVNVEMLIVARIIQGIAGAVMMPQVLALAQIMFPPKERAVAFSLFGLTAGLASVAGPVTGGLLIHANLWGLDWRPIFLINVPIGIACVIAGAHAIPDVKGNPDLKNDWVGIGLAALAIFVPDLPADRRPRLRLAGLELRHDGGRHSRRDASAGGSAARMPGARPSSSAQPDANRNFVFGRLGLTVFFSAMPGFFLILALFLQSGYQLDALHSGLTTIPFPIGVLVASIVAGRLGGKSPKLRIVFGAGLLVAAMLLLRHVVAGVGDHLVSTDFILPLLLGGLGTGITISPLFQTALAGVPPRDAGSGSGTLQSIQQVGGAFGVAIISQIFFSLLAAHMAGGLSQHEAFKASFETAVIYNIVCYVLVALSTLFLNIPPMHAAQPGHHHVAAGDRIEAIRPGGSPGLAV